MPVRPARSTLRVRSSSLQLVLSIALGLWLGFVLMLLTGWVAWRLGADVLFQPVAVMPALAHVAPAPAPARPAPSPAAVVPAAPVAAPDADEMFERYQQELQKQSLRQAEEAARANPANQNNPSCQFWLEQAQAAPSDESREHVARLCH